MPAIVRKNDRCSGHGCFPPRRAIEGSNNVFVEGESIHRQGDAWEYHACPDVPAHNGVMIEGSSVLFANNKPVARIGDSISCGSKASSGANTVFAG